MTELTKEQRERFVETYVENELDVILNCMDEDMRQELFKTSDEEELTKMLVESVKDITTIEDVRDGFDDVYDDAIFGTCQLWY